MRLDGSHSLDSRERAREKQISRDADERALELRAKSPAELQRENGHFAGLRVRVALERAKSLY